MNAPLYLGGQLVEQPAIALFTQLGWQAAEPSPNTGVIRTGSLDLAREIQQSSGMMPPA